MPNYELNKILPANDADSSYIVVSLEMASIVLQHLNFHSVPVILNPLQNDLRAIYVNNEHRDDLAQGHDIATRGMNLNEQTMWEVLGLMLRRPQAPLHLNDRIDPEQDHWQIGSLLLSINPQVVDRLIAEGMVKKNPSQQISFSEEGASNSIYWETSRGYGLTSVGRDFYKQIRAERIALLYAAEV